MMQKSGGNDRFSLWSGALFCCALWGLAPPLIKTGYSIMQIESTSSIILFAGLRFFLAGVMVIAWSSLQEKHFVHPCKKEIRPILVLACFQTFGQYVFYYLGGAHSTGMMMSVLSGLAALLELVFSCWLFRLEKMTPLKFIGCLTGFTGILIMNYTAGGFTFSLNGEGVLVLSQVCAAISAIFIQIFSRQSSPFLLSGWQFAIGGLAMIGASFLIGHPVIHWNGAGVLLLLMLAFVSAGAYTLWGVLLSRWPVSSVAVFGCTIGLFGVLFSALFLHEPLSLRIALGAIFMSAGILVVNLKTQKLETNAQAG
ncbi:DMT family transporter [Erysipelotrichaceae bacterium 51-3]